ncbi:DUF1003 domain-containing protein [Siccirubricoccus sp. G192]|uniref:DUF1003 domain-containing protein n=1 Tax=Siccirubricoccus sp. G192 TaxID=2849651 RepID=UPI001C2BBF64|nr:DUF1003 domain-containing protein [Siccirubricoccus sp. G192]MBV1798583.1 DUF1003 domain-containing protein [Siccirubricoccus sp. G192]
MDRTEPPGGVAPPMAARNIEEVACLEQEAAARRSLADRVADLIAGFAGTVIFVLLHLLWFVVWATVNAGLVPGVPAFDPYPFQLLCMIVSMEGVLLSTFVLIKQNRMSARADERNQLGLQIGLLSEQEVTKVIQMLEGISAHLGIQREVVDAEARELGRHTAVRGLAEQLRERLPPESQ